MRLFLIGGFLGSGKTTAVQQACMQLQQKTRVGVITNDQGSQLVVSAFIQSLNVPASEVTNGCFCCNYRELENSIKLLSHSEQPEIIFAESVGSCTDLIATVVNPLLQFQPQLQIVVSVFADAQVLLKLKKNETFFEPEVQYIYQKQLEEADVMVVNKVDLLEGDQLEDLKSYLLNQYTHKKIMFQNSLHPEYIQPWLSTLQQFKIAEKRKTLEIDYNTYGIGEAKLGWLDEELEILSSDNKALHAAYALIKKIHLKIRAGEYSIGHLKFLVNDGVQKRKISFVSVHHSNEKFSYQNTAANKVKFLINARVQAEPSALKGIVAAAIRELKDESGCKVIERKMLAFKPGFPKPTHRMLS